MLQCGLMKAFTCDTTNLSTSSVCPRQVPLTHVQLKTKDFIVKRTAKDRPQPIESKYCSYELYDIRTSCHLAFWVDAFVVTLLKFLTALTRPLYRFFPWKFRRPFSSRPRPRTEAKSMDIFKVLGQSYKTKDFKNVLADDRGQWNHVF